MEALANKKMNIVSSFNLSSDDVATISLLYSPLIGSEATNLYLTIQSLLERNNLKSETYTHEEIYTLLSLTEKKFLKARYQLEGIGLLTTYMDEEQNYLYVISSPFLNVCPNLSDFNSKRLISSKVVKLGNYFNSHS